MRTSSGGVVSRFIRTDLPSGPRPEHAERTRQDVHIDPVGREQRVPRQRTLRRAGGEHPALLQHHHPVGVTRGQLQIVEHKQAADPLLAAQPPDEPEDPMLVGQVEAGIGLIEQEETLGGIGRGLPDLGEHTRELDALALAPRECRKASLGEINGFDGRQRLSRDVMVRLAFPATAVGQPPKQYHFERGQGKIEP